MNFLHLLQAVERPMAVQDFGKKDDLIPFSRWEVRRGSQPGVTNIFGRHCGMGVPTQEEGLRRQIYRIEKLRW